ncbi:glycosyl hydrolase family 61-domain-containing protein [Tricharina praecox]|uniref:glycosyl hydrolase family 61-domain-containing protein n=1 Tax=Tricharina praecox TaxID=43433 RepID=UPI00221FD0AC|nr:glycosyl hydrolase family 61-domain-containing protein [Tricharina praecox]KAI5858694.1 glycosyl hydrolase family 61-domain-containing protein [Tricharina praecox]
MVQFGTLLPILATLLGAANAHTRVYSLWVNGVDQGDGRGVYVRSPPSNSPVKDVSSSDIICNVNNVAVAKSVPAAAGDEVTFEWYHDTRADDIIDSSHKGPITVYIADAATNGAGAVWTKIAESGLEGGVWAVDTLIANGGKHSVTLPSSLAAGDYLLRAEIIALHESETNYLTNSARGAQFYPSCSQVTVSSSGSVTPPGTFNFIGGYTPTDPGILFNLYSNPTTYPIPGPSVWTGAAGSAATTKVSTTAAATTKASTKASTTAVATSTYVAPAEETTSTYVAPVTTSTYVAPVATSTTKAVATTKASTTTYVAPVVTPTTLATLTKTTKPVTTKATITKATSTKASTTSYVYQTPATTPTVKTPESINKCLDEVNACISQAQSSIGGAVNFQPCEERRTSCYA